MASSAPNPTSIRERALSFIFRTPEPKEQAKPEISTPEFDPAAQSWTTDQYRGWLMCLAPIKATDTPDRNWTNEQCRAWLCAVLVIYCHQEFATATTMAKRYSGDGKMLRDSPCKSWRACIGMSDAGAWL